jgi:hypothetical protein
VIFVSGLAASGEALSRCFRSIYGPDQCLVGSSLESCFEAGVSAALGWGTGFVAFKGAGVLAKGIARKYPGFVKRLMSETGAVRFGRAKPEFKSTHQRKSLEGYKNILKKKLSGKQLDAFKDEIENSKVGEQFIGKKDLDEIFWNIINSVKP